PLQYIYFLYSQYDNHHTHLHSFPTRRSSDLFEIQYTYEAENIQRNLNQNNALALDLGVNNLVTAVSNQGRSFIIDGRKLKAVNQDRKSTRLNSSHVSISYAVFCLKKKKK